MSEQRSNTVAIEPIPPEILNIGRLPRTAGCSR